MSKFSANIRTYRGFLVLVDKEWCAFGHKFQDRIGHAQNKPNDTERSPIFIQFLDAVFQMIKQFPAAFEFSEELLIAMSEALFSGRFGNFLYNSVSFTKMPGNIINYFIFKCTVGVYYKSAQLGFYIRPLTNLFGVYG